MLVFFLIAQGRLDAPLLYLSDYLEADRRRYYASLAAIQQRGDPVPWVELFLAAVRTQAGDALTRATTILALRDRYLEEVVGKGTAKAIDAVDLICQSPAVTALRATASLGPSATV